MAAFDRIRSGYAGLDALLDSIRLGDNVVWQVDDVEEFRIFAEPFVRQAVRDKRDVIYIRFAQHDPVIKDLSGVTVRRFNPDEGFEAFTVAIHNEITLHGKDAFYVFDCLSELQSVWYTDLMMGNFFRVTCPYLFELDTVAYFPLLRDDIPSTPWQGSGIPPSFCWTSIPAGTISICILSRYGTDIRARCFCPTTFQEKTGSSARWRAALA